MASYAAAASLKVLGEEWWTNKEFSPLPSWLGFCG